MVKVVMYGKYTFIHMITRLGGDNKGVVYHGNKSYRLMSEMPP